MEQEYLLLYTQETKRMLRGKAAMDSFRNVALLLVTAMTFVAFSRDEPTNHRALLIGSFALFALTLQEAALFRLHAVTADRVSLIEKHLLSLSKNAQTTPTISWREILAESIVQPVAPSFAAAIINRIHQHYFIIYLVLDSVWLSKIYLYPFPAPTFSEILKRLQMGSVPGWGVFGFFLLFWVVFLIALFFARTRKKQKPHWYD